MSPTIGIPAAAVEDIKKYMDALEKFGGKSIFLDVSDRNNLVEKIKKVDGLLLAGGGDVEPRIYDADLSEEAVNLCTRINRERDVFEMDAIRIAFAEKKPMMGICRGVQVINVALGGTLYQDIPIQTSSAINHMQTEGMSIPTHKLKLLPESNLAKIMGVTEVETNTHHHQSLKDISPYLRAAAWTDDGVVEAAEYKSDNYGLFLQFHPEEMSDKFEKLFRSFISACGG